MKLSPKDKEIHDLACAMAKVPRKKLKQELYKLPLDKLFRVLQILNNHYQLLIGENNEQEK